MTLMRFLISLCLIPFGLHAAEWDLDTTFGSAGKVTVAFDQGGTLTDRIVKILKYPDGQGGKIVAIGSASLSPTVIGIAMARFHPDGSIDTTFGINGRVVKEACMSEVTHAAFDSGYRIVVVGTTPCSGNGTTDVGVIRFTRDGADDTTFAGDGGLGMKFTPSGDGNDRGGAVLVMSDDSLVVGGNKGNAAYIQKISSTGVISALASAQTNSGAYVRRVIDVVAGQANSSFWLIEDEGQNNNVPGTVWKINNATLGDDTTFSPDGEVLIVTGIGGNPTGSCGDGSEHRLSALVRFGTRIHAFGRTVGAAGGESFLWSAGENDSTIRTYRCLEIGGSPVNFSALAAQGSSDAGGSIYLAGSAGSPENFALYRVIKSDATSTSFIPDTSFANGLPVTTSFSAGAGQSQQSNAYSLWRHGSKSILGGLRVFNLASGDFDFAIARFGTDPPEVFANGFE